MAVLCMLGSTLLNGAQVGAFIPLIDRVANNHLLPTLEWFPGWLNGFIVWLNSLPQLALVNIFAVAIPLLFLFKSLFEFLQTFFMSDASQRVVRDLRQKMFDKFTSLSLDYHHHHATGSTMSRIMYDTGIVQNSLTEGLTDLLYQPFQIAVYLAIVLRINWKLAVTTLIVIPIIALVTVSIGRLLKKYSRQAQVVMGQLNSTLLESITGIQVIQAFQMEHDARVKFASTNERSYRINRKIQKRMNLLTPLTDFFGAVGASFVFWYGCRQVLTGSMTLGTFTAFFAAMMFLIRPFKRLAKLHSVNQQTVAAATRVFEILDLPPTIQEHPKAKTLPPLRHEIVYDKVSFQYEDQPVLRGISLTIPHGQILALVGPSGGGKTTLANLLPRFFDPTAGRVLLDGVDLRHVTLSSLRSQIGTVTQETTLFNDTVRANLAVGNPAASLAEIVEAAKAANAHPFISRMPKGYDTVVGERGSLLSGGERQRLAIARAILKNPPVLILDEATSQLDAQSERLITEALERICQERTVLLIAHRLSTVRLAHRIVVIQEGRIVEQGSHDELLKTSALYRRFCELQLLQPKGSLGESHQAPRDLSPRP
ncbi:MAG: ABC transporter ATP-binding protein [Candidatus Omnitrophica bacterium]|nr:ABC transporter ATP-binding protein [Candidatus Omnitrophota bacterium]